MSEILANRKAMVTGSGRGIGREIAIQLARSGASVVVCARTINEVAETVEQIKKNGGQAYGLQIDITSDSSIADAVGTASQVFGGPIDTLVNNAGTYKPRKFLDYSVQDWTTILDVNVLGMVRTTRAVLPQMLNLPRARIINLASIAGKKASFGQSAYNASKHAQIGITRCLALELGKTNVRVNAVCPGFTATELIDIDELAMVHEKSGQDVWNDIEKASSIGRTVSLSEIASIVTYLASPAADGINGQSLVVDGGIVYS